MFYGNYIYTMRLLGLENKRQR